MKTALKKRLIVVGITLAALLVWVAGDMFEFEFPYLITMYRASHAKTADGEPAADAIARTMGVRRSTLNWHRCSFCKNFDRELPRGMVRMQVSIAPEDKYVFAFDRQRGVLDPGDNRTEARFTSIPTP